MGLRGSVELSTHLTAKEAQVHRNAPLTPEGRFRLCQMIEEGWPVATAAESMRISRQTAHKWWRRYQEAGRAGLGDVPGRGVDR